MKALTLIAAVLLSFSWVVLAIDTLKEQKGRANDLLLNISSPNGPAFGGAIGTARSVSVILQDLLANESKLLGKNVKELLYVSQKTKSGKTIDMTLAWHVAALNGTKYFYKEGGGAGYHCEMRIYPEKGLASVIVANRTSLNTRKQLGKIDSVFIE